MSTQKRPSEVMCLLVWGTPRLHKACDTCSCSLLIRPVGLTEAVQTARALSNRAGGKCRAGEGPAVRPPTVGRTAHGTTTYLLEMHIGFWDRIRKIASITQAVWLQMCKWLCHDMSDLLGAALSSLLLMANKYSNSTNLGHAHKQLAATQSARD